MTLKWREPKDPDEVLDYLVDWSASLPADTIDTSTWIVPSGITKDSDSHDNTKTTIWLSGGTLNETYELTNRIVTDGGRTMDRTMRLRIKAK